MRREEREPSRPGLVGKTSRNRASLRVNDVALVVGLLLRRGLGILRSGDEMPPKKQTEDEYMNYRYVVTLVVVIVGCPSAVPSRLNPACGTPLPGADWCTPSRHVYPLFSAVPPPLEQERHRLH